MRSARRLFILAGLMLLPSVLAGQQPNRAFAVSAGPSQYDLSGTGTTSFAAIRVAFGAGRLFLIEPGLTYLPYRTQFGARVHYFLPEAQLQIQWPGDRIRPYLGAGVGASWASSSREDEMDVTLSGAGGIRIPVATDWMVGGELRIRTINPWVGTTADWGALVAKTF